VQGSRAAPPYSSRLRRERQRRNWILADVVREIDVRLKDSGVTESLVSAWELGKHRTSARYRAVLCEVFNLPAEALFADQDEDPRPPPTPAEAQKTGPGTNRVRVVHMVSAVDQLRAALLQVVCQAENLLAAVGSRSRDQSYLHAIEQALQDRPRLIHYRVLIGPPRRELLKEHLLRLLELRDPDSREHGFQTLHIGLIEDLAHQPEHFFVASERTAVVVIPSVNTAENFDSGVVLEHAQDALGLVRHAREVYAGAQRLETVEAVQALQVVR
jgi:transcriptional regulator with XRE-family HTH domain